MGSDRLTNACCAPLNGKIVHLIGSGRKMHIGSRKTVWQYLRQPLSKFLKFGTIRGLKIFNEISGLCLK